MAFLQQHAPILLAVLPMLAAPLAMIVGHRGFAFFISLLAAIGSAIASISLLLLVSDGTVISYHIGGWVPPLGIEYRIDAANALVLTIVSTMCVIVLPYARTSIELEIEEKHHTLFYACLMMCLTGLLGVTATGDAFNVFVFLEISSLATYTLVALGAHRDKRALSAAYDYLVLGTIGATFFVIGLGLLYMSTGSLNLADIAERITTMENNRTVQTAFAFIVVGMGLKVAMFPLHRWLPSAYTYAPSAVTAFLAATSTKVALYVVLRFLFTVYSPEQGFERDTLELIILPVALLAMFLGSLIAIYQSNAKRLMAYSSIAQVGYMLLGLAFASVSGIAGTLVHIFNHAITKGALFLAIGIVIYCAGTARIPAMAGLGKRMPLTAAAITLGGLSLIGVPGTAGFISKWVLLQAALEKGWWIVAILIVLASLLAIIYVWKIVEIMYLQPVPSGSAVIKAPLTLLIPTWALVAASIWFGLHADFTVGVARQAADSLLSGGYSGDSLIIFGAEGR